MRGVDLAQERKSMDFLTLELLKNHVMDCANELRIMYSVALDECVPDDIPEWMYRDLETELAEADQSAVYTKVGEFDYYFPSRYDAAFFWIVEDTARTSGMTYEEARKTVREYMFDGTTVDLTDVCAYLDGNRNTPF